IIKGNISVTFGYEEYSRLKFDKKKIFVTTPEKALIFLKLDPTAFQSCSLVILDECHILGDRNRGATAEIVLSLLLKLSSNLRVILMSALMENNTELASWLTTVTNKKTAVISSKWKPTRIARFIVSLDESTKQPYKNNENYSENLAIHTDSESPWNSKSDFLLDWTLPIQLHSKRRGTEFPFVNDAARVLSEELVSKGKRTMLFVIRNRHHVFSFGDKWEKESIKPFNLNSYEKALINIAEFELGISSHVAKLLTEKCIAVHSSSMLESEKLLTLSAFGRRESNVRTFIATGTLSQGMNLNFDAVVIAGTDRFHRATNQRVEHEILNAMGRAARANYAIYGISFIVPTQKISKHFSKAH
ncbi:MAG: DEAD/DEAH box helicase, partial [Thermotogota bacterium]|nr:DEAD/DEAH box helicase [Thermotogota bacterium]